MNLRKIHNIIKYFKIMTMFDDLLRGNFIKENCHIRSTITRIIIILIAIQY